MRLLIGVFYATLIAIASMITVLFVHVELKDAEKVYNKNFSFTCYDPYGKVLISSTGTRLRYSRIFKNTIIEDNSKSLTILNDSCLITEIL